MKLSKKNLAVSFVWFVSANVLLFLTLFSVVQNIEAKPKIVYSVFESKPLAEVSTSDSVTTEDARAAIIDQYFARYKCPLHGTGKLMVQTADKYDIPFWIIPAIAWQESTCGKVMIPGSHNAWGYGIYGSVVTKFEDWETAIDTVGRYLSKNFFKKGITEPCEIEKIYTPPSKGRWCKSITYFREELQNYETR